MHLWRLTLSSSILCRERGMSLFFLPFFVAASGGGGRRSSLPDFVSWIIR